MEKDKDLKEYIVDPKAKNHIKLVEAILKRIEGYLKKINQRDNFTDEKLIELCENVSKLSSFLESTLDMEKGGKLSINLLKLYQHIRYCVQRVIDENDFSYIESAEKVIKEINSGWGKVAAAA